MGVKAILKTADRGQKLIKRKQVQMSTFNIYFYFDNSKNMDRQFPHSVSASQGYDKIQ